MSHHQLSDPELVSKCISGSEDAWAALVDRYSALVYSVPARHRLPQHLREEVFQSVWMITVRHLEELRDPQSLAAWLIRTTQRETWRISKTAKTPLHDQAQPAYWTDPDEAEMLEQRQRLRRALAMMDERCRSLLLALFRDDRPDYDRLAERFGMPRGSIGPTRGRCLHKLRTLLARADSEQPPP